MRDPLVGSSAFVISIASLVSWTRLFAKKNGAACAAPLGELFRVRSDYLPVPVRFETCGLPIALSFTCNVPVLVPVCVGVNTTLIVHVDLAARLVEQVFAETLKSPVVEMSMPVSATACRFVSVNTFAGLDTPTVSFGNFAETGVSLACTPPVPERATVCGLLGELSVRVRVPVRVPSAVGVKVTMILQLFPVARVPPQGFVLGARAKSPFVVMLLMLSVTVPVLVRVTALAAPVAPTTTVPHVSDDGVTVTVGPIPLGLTVNVSGVVAVVLPDVPVIVRLNVPVAAVALAVRVSVLVVAVGFGLKTAVTPLGRVEMFKVTLPLKPLCGVTVMVLVPLPPCTMPTELGLALKLKPMPASTSTGIGFDSMPLATAYRL